MHQGLCNPLLSISHSDPGALTPLPGSRRRKPCAFQPLPGSCYVKTHLWASFSFRASFLADISEPALMKDWVKVFMDPDKFVFIFSPKALKQTRPSCLILKGNRIAYRFQTSIFWIWLFCSFVCLLPVLGSTLVQNPNPSHASLAANSTFLFHVILQKEVLFFFLSLLKKMLKLLGSILYSGYKAHRIVSPTRLEYGDFLCEESQKPLSSINS